MTHPFNVEYSIIRELLKTGFDEIPIEVTSSLCSSMEGNESFNIKENLTSLNVIASALLHGFYYT